MKIEITKVEQKKYVEVEILHIYPHGKKEKNFYRRHDAKTWTHFLGMRNNWVPYMQPEMLEEAYVEYIRKKALTDGKESTPSNK